MLVYHGSIGSLVFDTNGRIKKKRMLIYYRNILRSKPSSHDDVFLIVFRKGQVFLSTTDSESDMKKLFSLIFIFLLLAPAGVWMTGIDFGIPVDRLGLKPPRFFSKALLDNEYYLSFDQYFKDNFSLRGPLIFAKNFNCFAILCR